MKKIRLDMIFLLIFLVVMDYRLFPKAIHEYVGTLILLPLFFHLKWNWSFFTSLGRGKWTGVRKLSAACNFFLVIMFLVAFITGIFYSRHLFVGIVPEEFHRNIFLHRLHKASSYLMLIGVGVHVGLHWENLWQKFKGWKPVFKGRAGQMATRLLLVSFVGIGVAASFLDRIGARIMLERVHKTAVTGGAWPIFILCFFGILALYGTVAYCFKKCLLVEKK